MQGKEWDASQEGGAGSAVFSAAQTGARPRGRLALLDGKAAVNYSAGRPAKTGEPQEGTDSRSGIEVDFKSRLLKKRR